MRRRSTKWLMGLNVTSAEMVEMYPPLRQYWRAQNHHEREMRARQRRYRKTYDKKRPKCRCEAYKFPHRPGGGLCGYPDPPAVSWREREAAEVAERVQDYIAQGGEPHTNSLDELAAHLAKIKRHRPYRNRYTGILRQICRNNGLNPIRDRKLIDELMPEIVALAKQLKRGCPKWQYKYRNMEIIDNGNGSYTVRGIWATAGPTM